MSFRCRLVLLGWLSACSPLVRQPAPLQGPAADIRQLAGTWRGEFRSKDGAKVGTIFFELRPGGAAYGSVILDRVIPTPWCDDMTRPPEMATVAAPLVLQFRSILIGNGSLGGSLLPYEDPELACWMDTWFEGQLLRDTLRGSYFARRTDTVSVRAGSWWATRS